MRRTLFAALLAVSAVLPAVSQADSYEERLARSDEARARERCLKGGGKPDTPEFQACVRDTAAWMAQNRALQRRAFSQ